MSEGTNRISDSEGFAWSLLLLAPSMLLGGWILRTMWGWFIVPLGAPAISLWHAMGLFLTVRLFVGMATKERKEHPLMLAIEGAVVGLALLGIGALVHLGL
ncbi:MAG: hypothetical protein ABFE07_28385 [Armatimonadia bacterium]